MEQFFLAKLIGGQLVLSILDLQIASWEDPRYCFLGTSFVSKNMLMLGNGLNVLGSNSYNRRL